jgi:pimeloyl-ACP methyl ester carboxylesterase
MPTRSTFLICTRALDAKGRFISEPGETLFLKVPPGVEEYTPDNRLTPERWRKQVAAAADGDEDEITGSRGDILVFVHGYNNDIRTVLWRTRTLQRTLTEQGWRGLVIGFDWPSDNSTLNYLEDRSDAAEVALRLVKESLELLIQAQVPNDSEQEPCKLNVHLLGHSTGAYVIMEAFAQAEKIGDYFRSPWRIGQVALIGGDVASDSLREDCDWSAPMFRRIMRLTNYSNQYDKVLGVSNAKRLGTAPRVGRVGLPPNASRKAVNVDCSAYFLTKDPKQSEFVGTFNHSWHIGDPVFALDLAMTLEGEIDRDGIPTRDRMPDGLVLRGGRTRPQYREHWDAKMVPV